MSDNKILLTTKFGNSYELILTPFVVNLNSRGENNEKLTAEIRLQLAVFEFKWKSQYFESVQCVHILENLEKVRSRAYANNHAGWKLGAAEQQWTTYSPLRNVRKGEVQ